MHPVLAQEAIQIVDLNRRPHLAAAERNRLVKAATPSEGRRPAMTTLPRVLDGLSGVGDALSRFRAARGVSMPDESAAVPTA